jgi:hypothetical protein
LYSRTKLSLHEMAKKTVLSRHTVCQWVRDTEGIWARFKPGAIQRELPPRRSREGGNPESVGKRSDGCDLTPYLESRFRGNDSGLQRVDWLNPRYSTSSFQLPALPHITLNRTRSSLGKSLSTVYDGFFAVLTLKPRY